MPGHLRRRGKGWQARYPDPLRPGTAKIERTFRTKREAEDWLVQQQAAIIDGTHVSPRAAGRPFAEVVEAWRESWPGRLEPRTQLRYDQALRVHLLPELGGRKVGEITHETVQRHVNGLVRRGDLAPGTVRNVYAVLRTAMAYAVRMGLTRNNPCTSIDLPRPRRQEMLFLTADEVWAVAETIDPYYRVLAYVAAYTGLRAGELGALRREDIDLLRGTLTVRRALKDVNGQLVFGETKTHAHRTITLPRFLREMLSVHLTCPSPGGSGPEALVFTGKNGAPLRHNLLYNRYFKRAVRESLPPAKHRLRFHDLRHTCAALLIQQGAHPKLISARLGHSSVQITLDRYGHLFPSIEEALADALDAAFASAETAPPASPTVLTPAARSKS